MNVDTVVLNKTLDDMQGLMGLARIAMEEPNRVDVLYGARELPVAISTHNNEICLLVAEFWGPFKGKQLFIRVDGENRWSWDCKLKMAPKDSARVRLGLGFYVESLVYERVL